MSAGVGFTAEEIREFVHEYVVQPQRTKAAWLAVSGVSYDRLRNWRSALFERDLRLAWWCAAGGADDLDHASFLAGGGPQVEGLPVGEVSGRGRHVCSA